MTSHFYDAVIFYASMVRDLDIAGSDYRKGNVLGDFYANYTFNSPVNGKVVINDNGDRMSPYVIRTFDHSTSRYGVGWFSYTVTLY